MPRKNATKKEKVAESQRLRTLRETLQMTQRELAKEFRVSHTAIALWENGQRTIPGAVLKLLDIYEERLEKHTS